MPADSTFHTAQCPGYACGNILWPPQYESYASPVVHKITNSQIIKDKVHNVKDTLFDNDKAPNIKGKLTNVNFPYLYFKFPFVKPNFYLGKSSVACRWPSRIPRFTQAPCYNQYKIFGKREIKFINGKQISKAKQNYSNRYSVQFHSNLKAKQLKQVAPKYFARQNKSVAPKFSPAKSEENRPAPWPNQPAANPAQTCLSGSSLADARGVTKWPPSRDLPMPVNLLIIKIALMDINLMLINNYLHNFTPHVCFYEFMKLGIITSSFKATYLILLRHCTYLL